MADDSDRIREIFAQASQLPPGQRAGLLDVSCGDDPERRRLLEDLLAAHDEATSIAFLRHPTGGGDGSRAAVAAAGERAALEGPGSVIDRYRLLQLIGEGGFGSVYMAEQEKPVRRRVALKIIKLGMDTKQVIARFEAERQALALMEHPNIAKVLDAGSTATGRPYFVMELVKGLPITAYCDEQSLTTPQRLELFMEVCQAVQHAHQKGIIHRDLKPSNVLVTLTDDRPVPKVIDFGIAKATSRQLTERTVFTEQGQFIGTPEYMSPEQAEPGGIDIDTRSDVYALGVLLYELLTGTTPFDGRSLRRAGLAEIQRIIREEDPPRPSTRLSALSSLAPAADVSADAATLVSGEIDAQVVTAGSSVQQIARHRRTDPRSLSRFMRGDLDWIVMKALEKDRTRRYETANGFAADIRRYLDDEPVTASPPSTGYRLRKFVRRNRAGVITAATAVLLLLAFAVTMTVQANRIATERDRANRERAISDEVVEFQADMLRRVDPQEMGRDLVADLRERVATSQDERNATDDEKTAALSTYDALLAPISTTDAARRVIDVNIMEPSTAAIDEEFGNDPGTEARLRYAVGRTYRSLGMPDKALPQFERSHELRLDALGPEHRDTLRALSMIGDMHFRNGNHDESEAAITEALETWQRTIGMASRDTLDAQLLLGVLCLSVDRDAEARDLLLEVVEEQEKLLGPDHVDIADSTSNLGVAYINLDQFDEAEIHLQRALEIYTRENGPDSGSVQFTKRNIARILGERLQHDEAIAMMHEVVDASRRVKGAMHPSTMSSMDLLASAYSRADRHLDAIEITRRSLQDRRDVLGNRHPDTQESITDLGIALGMAGEHQAALPLLEEALEVSRETLGPDHPTTLDAIGNLGVGLWYLGRIEEAAEQFRESYEVTKRVFGPDHEESAFKASNLGIVYTRLQRLEEAEAVITEAYEIYVAKRGPDDPRSLRTRSVIASLEFEQGDKPAALAILEEVHPALVRVSGASDQETIEAAYNRIICYRHLDRDAEALPLIEEYIRICTETRGPDHDQTLDFVAELAALHFEADRVDAARPLTARVIAARRSAADAPEASPKELNDCAMILVTAEPWDLRVPEDAVAYASRANEMTEHADAAYLDTLAQAQHASGDAAGAAETQRQALERLHADAPDRVEYEKRLAEYLAASADR